jgi:hypothetical protein
MSKEQQIIITELLKTISDSKLVSDMSWSTANELTSLVRMLQVA